MKKLFTIITACFISTIIAQNKIIKKSWTSYSQSIDISSWEGHDFEVSAYLKKDKSSKGKSALWSRIDKTDNTYGFFANDAYNETVIVTNNWKKFKITGKVDSNADQLYFGAFCQGNGNFYFDAFEVKVKTKQGIWKKLSITNSGFENDSKTDTWNEGIRKNKIENVANYSISYNSADKYEGTKALKISASNIIGNNNGKYVTVNNVKLYYETYGEGEPLLMIHGNGQSLNAFINQVDYFSKHYKVILVDCRGRGNATFDYNTELTYTLEANDMKLFLDKIGISKTHILGWSDGGIIGIVMAINYPEKVDKLIAMGANINPQGLKDLDALHRNIKEIESSNKQEKQLFLSLYKLMAYYPKLTYKDLNVITSKTLIIAGDNDEIKNTHTVKMFEAIKDAQLAILPNETHYLPEENPDLFNQIVLKFLSK
ncbi:alpha/beta fold hydrolase [Tenacibaculum geojense]|uniref:Alpha/beta fold hydrolase n=1 Tax=Tenacibaculum geojense TaxID=915352 RepID=A0ABW3JPY3_9FLAO